MRRIGTVENASDAQKFCDFLLTRDIEATADKTDEGSDIWIRDESDVETARKELEAFRGNESLQRYEVVDQVRQIREQKVAENTRRLKNLKKFKASNRVGRGLAAGGTARQETVPVTIAIIIASVLASFGSDFGNVRYPNPAVVENYEQELSFPARMHLSLSFVDRYRYVETEGDDWASMKQGQLWRLVTPMFLHGSMMHLLFNMFMLYMLGGAVERLHGSLFAGGLIIISQVVGLIVQVLLPDWLPETLQGSPFVVGASGAVFGIFGFIWIRPKVESMYPIVIPPFNVAIMLGWLLICMTPIIPHVANGAHVGGLVAGVAVALGWRANLS